MSKESKQEIMKPGEQVPSTEMAAPTGEVTPMQAIVYAIEKGIPAEQLSQLMKLSDHYEDREAKKAFVRAMAEFKRNPPRIIKDIQVSFGNTNYSHADISKASDLIGVELLKHGLTHHWETSSLDNGMTRVACIITHVDGYSEESSMQAASDSSGSKNPIQAAGSTVSYLQRYTLLTAVGIVAQGVDNDGRAPSQETEFITSEQVNQIDDLIEEHSLDKGLFLKWAKVEKLKDIPASNLEAVMAGIQKSIDNLNKGKE